MTADHDSLRALFLETALPEPPAHDPGFALEVMKRVEKRRLMDGLFALFAAVLTVSAVLFAAAFIFAWGYFDAVHSHFEILMLLFMAAIPGFCLTHDLFNLFVWFELMSVAAFALTAYPLGRSSLEGAFNFTIANAFGSYMMLAGIGLLEPTAEQLAFRRQLEAK